MRNSFQFSSVNKACVLSMFPIVLDKDPEWNVPRLCEWL